MKDNSAKICIGCAYYYITWDKNFPNGCKGFGFKSKKIPFIEVKECSGQDCQMYMPKFKKG